MRAVRESRNGMIRPGFRTSSERRELVACVRSHREDHGVARRANALLRLDEGKSCPSIAEFLYLPCIPKTRQSLRLAGSRQAQTYP